jgi:hypothetical protein
MNNSDIIDMIARELGYNRFCGTIAAKNSNGRLNKKEECEQADVLASNNLSLFREDALNLMQKILGELMYFPDCHGSPSLMELYKYCVTSLEGTPLDTKDQEREESIVEITNPILNLEV